MIVLTIEGMMCPRCQKHVEDALTAVANVPVFVDLEKGIATVSGFSATADQLKTAVEAAGYTVTDVTEK